MKKKSLIVLLSMIMMMGCLTGCSTPNPTYTSSGRSIAVNGLNMKMTTANVRFYDYNSERLITLPNDTYALPGGLDTTMLTIVDRFGQEYAVAVSTPLLNAPEWFLVYLHGLGENGKNADLYEQ